MCNGELYGEGKIGQDSGSQADLPCPEPSLTIVFD